VKVKIKGPAPVYASLGAVGADLVAASVEYDKGNRLIIYSTGLSLELPYGYEAQVRARSSLTQTSWYMPHGIGTIDQDYRGEIKVVYAPRDNGRNIYDITLPYKVGERCGQLVIAPVVIADFTEDELTDTERGDKGFGSTGKTVKTNKKITLSRS
jgi:dUTP pyrophosphatase